MRGDDAVDDPQHSAHDLGGRWRTQNFRCRARAIDDYIRDGVASMNVRDFGDSVPWLLGPAAGARWFLYFGDVKPENRAEAHALAITVSMCAVHRPKGI